MAADDPDEIDEMDDDDAVEADAVDDEELDEEELVDDDDVVVPGVDDEDDDVAVVDDEDEDEDDEKPSKAAKATTDDDDDDDEEPGPDDVEADLDTILKGKIASEDDLDDDDEDEDEPLVVPVKKTTPAEQADGVTARQEGEFTCPGCFMVVHPRQFGRRSNPTCPSGEEDCPGIKIAFGTS